MWHNLMELFRPYVVPARWLTDRYGEGADLTEIFMETRNFPYVFHERLQWWEPIPYCGTGPDQELYLMGKRDLLFRKEDMIKQMEICMLDAANMDLIGAELLKSYQYALHFMEQEADRERIRLTLAEAVHVGEIGLGNWAEITYTPCRHDPFLGFEMHVKVDTSLAKYLLINDAGIAGLSTGRVTISKREYREGWAEHTCFDRFSTESCIDWMSPSEFLKLIRPPRLFPVRPHRQSAPPWGTSGPPRKRRRKLIQPPPRKSTPAGGGILFNKTP